MSLLSNSLTCATSVYSWAFFVIFLPLLSSCPSSLLCCVISLNSIIFFSYSLQPFFSTPLLSSYFSLPNSQRFLSILSSYVSYNFILLWVSAATAGLELITVCIYPASAAKESKTKETSRNLTRISKSPCYSFWILHFVGNFFFSQLYQYSKAKFIFWKVVVDVNYLHRQWKT